MTNAIETTKREMYKQLNCTKFYGAHHLVNFESALELHLEELRKALKTSNEDTQGANILKDEFQQRLMRMTEERDQIQGRLHAIDEAYDKSQRNLGIAGDEIKRLQALLKAKIEIACTSPQDSRENVTSDDREANALVIVLGALVDAQRIVINWGMGELKSKKSMIKMESVLATEQLRKAMKVFERPKDDAMLKECAHSYRNPKDTLCAECGKRFMTPAQWQEEGFRSGQIGCNGQAGSSR